MILPANMTPIRDDGKPLQKHIYDWLTSDSAGEKCFAKDLDNSAEVVVYAKLPGGFAIPTPVGSYNPDWAIAFQEGKVKHLYFVAETKGSMSDMQLRAIEKSKIACAEKFFMSLGTKDAKYHVTYKKVTNYGDLMNKATSNLLRKPGLFHMLRISCRSYFARYSKISAALVSGFTFGITCSMMPSSLII